MQTRRRGHAGKAAQHQNETSRLWDRPPVATDLTPEKQLLAQLRARFGPIRGQQFFEAVLGEQRAVPWQ